ncbi:hypothetical protein GWI33_010583 [Rhynchophorus ferrugineus]|uniref:Uncharacterized protein n=1 Tax=Rhynchophorus ferrugineus TaxID=354439 RepID=A0A834ISH0_RHYFE|nr:hypothetical protein GWI33_010583 [Rhynchophorus ferrugineus]
MDKKEFRMSIKHCFLKGKNTVEAKTWLDAEIPDTVKINHQGLRLLHSVIGPFEGRNRRKTVAFEEKESAASPRQCTVSQARENDGKIHELCFELFPHPPYSPDLSPSDYFLFPNLKRMLNKIHIFDGVRHGQNEICIRKRYGEIKAWARSPPLLLCPVARMHASHFSNPFLLPVPPPPASPTANPHPPVPFPSGLMPSSNLTLAFSAVLLHSCFGCLQTKFVLI